MDHFFKISIRPDFNYYLLFYLIGFTLSFLIVFYRIIKLRENKTLLSTVTAAIFLSFVLGCKLVPAMEYYLFANTDSTSLHNVSQMAFGGILFSFILIILLRGIYKLPESYWYAIGLAILVGLFVQKPGCLLGACCKGMASDQSFGLMYGDAITRHPLQIYEWLLYLVSILIYLTVRTKKGISTYYLAVILFCFVQFLAEFIRDAHDTIAFSDHFFGLKTLQWNYLILALFSLCCILKSETNWRIRKHLIEADKSLGNIVLLILVIASFYLIHNQLFRSEVLAINLAFIPALYFNIVLIVGRFFTRRYGGL